MTQYNNLTFRQAQDMVKTFKFAGFINARYIKHKPVKNIFGTMITEYSVQTGTKVKANRK